ncbi:MAG: hypothetical protein R6W82_01305 [bacterium]
MRFEDVVATVVDLPCFTGSLLLAGDRDPGDVRRQLSRWKDAGKVIQLRRNLYVLAEPWRKIRPHPFLLANAIQSPSYVSLQSALDHHGLIPEAVPVTTSVTTARPTTYDTPLGRFTYRHVREEVFFGYRTERVQQDQQAFVADAAKALLDLVYLTPGGDDPEYLASLRLKDLEPGHREDLKAYARRWDKPKIHRAVERILDLQGEVPGRRDRP